MVGFGRRWVVAGGDRNETTNTEEKMNRRR
jgi:hypothetical protein